MRGFPTIRTIVLVSSVAMTTVSLAEPGSSPSTARVLEIGAPAVAATLAWDAETHWYRFMAVPPLVYTVRVDNGTLWDHDLALRVFADGDAGASTGSAWRLPPDSAIVWTNTGGVRSYYVSVTPFLEFTTGTYSIAVSANNADSDGDGLPDAWETRYYGGPTQADPAATNAAGVTNWESFITGTDPRAPDGALRFQRVQRTTAGVVLSWPAVPYAAYRVDGVSSLHATHGWNPRARVVTGAAAGPQVHLEPTNVDDASFHRVVYEID